MALFDSFDNAMSLFRAANQEDVQSRGCTWHLFDVMTGLLIDEFEPVTGSWSVGINEPEDIQVKIDLNSDRERARDWRNLAVGMKTGIAVEQDGRWYGGPILPQSWDEDAQSLSLTAKGVMILLDKQFVLPPAAETGALIIAATKLPNPAMDTRIVGVDYGTMIKRLVQQWQAWPGASIPIEFQPDRVGTREKGWLGLDMKPLGAAIEDISQLDGGCEFRFELRRKSETHLGWLLVTAPDDVRRLQSDTVHYWDSAAIEPSVSGVNESSNPSEMADVYFATGGRTEDTALVARARSTQLRDAGYPLMMQLDSTHSDVSVQATLDGYAAAGLRNASKEIKFRTFEVRADMAPYLNEYHPGDLAQVNIEDSGYLPDGDPVRRIAKLSGDQDAEFIKVTCGEVYE